MVNGEVQYVIKDMHTDGAAMGIPRWSSGEDSGLSLTGDTASIAGQGNSRSHKPHNMGQGENMHPEITEPRARILPLPSAIQ